MKIFSNAFFLIVTFFCTSTVNGHHSYAGVFDMKTVVKFDARVVRLELLNPHTSVYLKVTNEHGEAEDWVMEAPGKLSLARRGWTEDMFKSGETITVHGNPSLRGRNAVWLDRVILADGTEFIDPLIADEAAIEEERRVRLLKAQQGK